MKNRLEKEWVYEDTVTCVVMVNPMGFRTGYIDIPKGHPWASMNYDDIPIVTHGGLTFSGNIWNPDIDWEFVGPDGIWLGYDCGHGFDGFDIDLADESMKRALGPTSHLYEGPVRTLDYCVETCESMARQAMKAYQPILLQSLLNKFKR